jgi:nitroreductase
MIMDLFLKRRSIRKFNTTKIPTDIVQQLIQGALLAPSSRSLYPYEFVVIDDTTIIQKLAQAKPHGAAFLSQATLSIVICGNEHKSDVWVEDCSIAATHLMLLATELGLGSCWVQIRKRLVDDTRTASAYIQELLKIPQHIHVEAIIGFGYPAEKKEPHDPATLKYNQVYHQSYGCSYYND